MDSQWLAWQEPSCNDSRQAYCSRDAASTVLDRAIMPNAIQYHPSPLRWIWKAEQWNLKRCKRFGMSDTPDCKWLDTQICSENDFEKSPSKYYLQINSSQYQSEFRQYHLTILRSLAERWTISRQCLRIGKNKNYTFYFILWLSLSGWSPWFAPLGLSNVFAFCNHLPVLFSLSSQTENDSCLFPQKRLPGGGDN